MAMERFHSSTRTEDVLFMFGSFGIQSVSLFEKFACFNFLDDMYPCMMKTTGHEHLHSFQNADEEISPRAHFMFPARALQAVIPSLCIYDIYFVQRGMEVTMRSWWKE